MPSNGRRSTHRAKKVKSGKAEVDLNMPIHIDAFPLLEKPVQVETTVGELEACLTRQHNYVNSGDWTTPAGYTSTLAKAIAFDVEDTMQKIQLGDKDAEQEWANFCNDVLILYCMRHALTNAEIPIVADDLDIDTADAVAGRSLVV